MFLSKKILSTLTCSAILSSVFAFEWGGLVSADGKYYDTENSKITEFKESTLDTKLEGSLWLKIPFTENGDNYFTTEGKYSHDISRTDSKNTITKYVDLSLFKFVFQKQFESEDATNSLSLSLGRFSVSDLSGIVFSQAADGALVKYSGAFDISAYASYTGLLNRKAITMLPDSADEADEDKLYDLTDKFVVASVSVSFPNTFANQTISFEGLGAFGLEDETYRNLNGTVAISGPITSSIFYNVSSTFNFVKAGDVSTNGNLSQGNMTYYSDYKSASVGLSALYASKNFTTFTSQTAVESQEDKKYNDILKAGVSGSIKPLDNVLLSLSADSVFDSVRGDDKDKFGFAGIQVQGGVSYQVFSDFNLNLSAIHYGDKDNSDNNKTTFELKAVITF